MKKFILILAAIVLFAANVFANTDVYVNNGQYDKIFPMYIAIISTNNDLSISSGEADCYGYTQTQSGYKAKVKVELQRKVTSWSTIKSWEKTSTGLSATVDETYSVNRGYSYRLKTTHYSLNSNGNEIESTVKYSSAVNY